MRNILLISILLSACILTHSQDFQFNMYFEDSGGYKDTLTIGFDQNGSELIDSDFGEINIIALPFDSLFDVRITNSHSIYGEVSYHTKKQILPDSCDGWYFPLVEIDIHSKNWPVTASWDSAIFMPECIHGSVFTSFHPGGWFDVVGFHSDLGRVDLANKSSVTFTSNYDPSEGLDEHYSYVSGNDTIPVFWMSFGHVGEWSASIDDSQIEIEVFPNPFEYSIWVPLPSDIIEEIQVYSLTGVSQPLIYTNGIVDLPGLNPGCYILVVETTDHETLVTKIIKE